MAVKKILTIGRYEKLLRTRAEPVKKINKDVKQLIEDIKDTIAANPAVGLAAPQIGVLKRVFGARMHYHEEQPEEEMSPPTIFINPEIVELSEEVERGFDACLSIPGMMGYTDRNIRIRVHYLDEDGKRQDRVFTGYDARVILHEYDHLEGVLFFDRLKSLEDLFVVTVDGEGKHVHTPYLKAVQRAETAAAKASAKAISSEES